MNSQTCNVTTLINDILYHKNNVQIPEDKSTEAFFIELKSNFDKALKPVGQRLMAIILTDIATSMYWIDSIGGIMQGVTSPEGLELLPFPNMINYHINNLSVTGEIEKIQYIEKDFCKEYPEIYGFIIPNTEEKAIKFIQFCKEKLNLTLENIELYQGNKETIDIDSFDMIVENYHVINELYGGDFIEKSINTIGEEFLTVKQYINLSDVVEELGPRGKATEGKILELIKNNNFEDDFVADILGYYGLDFNSSNENTNKKIYENSNIFKNIQVSYNKILEFYYEEDAVFEEKFSASYPFKESFDELNVNEWCEQFTNESDFKIAISNMNDALIIFKNSLIAISEVWEDDFNENYPFHKDLDELNLQIKDWVFSLTNRNL